MTLIKKGIPLLIGVLLIANITCAQENKQDTTKKVTNKELKSFSHVAVKAQKINRQFKREAMKNIQKSNLSMQRYRTIAMSKMNPQKSSDTLSISKKEKKEYQKLHAKLSSLQKDMQTKLKEEVQKEGLTLARFRQIAMKVRQDKELQQKVRKLVMQQMKSGKSDGGIDQ